MLSLPSVPTIVASSEPQTTDWANADGRVEEVVLSHTVDDDNNNVAVTIIVAATIITFIARVDNPRITPIPAEETLIPGAVDFNAILTILLFDFSLLFRVAKSYMLPVKIAF
jgi:hypothetical protein